MKAMILAAGLGTRLRPLTDSRPKALVEINGRTLLEITLGRLRLFGVDEVVINVHHFADMVIDYLKSHNNFGMRIDISREDDVLLDTGGGLKKASWFFLESSRGALNNTGAVVSGKASDPGKPSTPSPNDQTPGASRNPDAPFILHNVDVISTIDIRRMLAFHEGHGALATLAVQSRPSARLLLFNNQNLLVGRAASGTVPLGESVNAGAKRSTVFSSEARNPSSGLPLATGHGPAPLAFSGIHIISPRLLPLLTETGIFSIIDAYLRLAARGEKILGFRADEYYWRDLGRPADLSQAALDLEQRTL
jgi:NDP-sugar pyrophosphorylase family protein